MTNQQIFDKVAKHLLAQGRRSTAPDGHSCQYRGQEGRSCAVGCLIPDDIYDKRIEAIAVSVLSGDIKNTDGSFVTYTKADQAYLAGVLLASGLKPENAKLLGCLQQVHDCADPASWKAELKQVARRFRLKTSALK